jgi:glycosyltransferase involved in cell wall biosynthesis
MAVHVAEITSALDGTGGLEVDVACQPDLPVHIPNAVHSVTIPRGPLKGHLAAVRRLRSIIEEGSYDVVHAHGLRAGIDAALAARRSSTITYVTVHNLVQPEVAGRVNAVFYAWAERLVVRLADRVFCVSQEIATHLQELEPRRAARISVTYLGIPEPAPARRSRSEVRAELGVRDAPLVVTASRLRPQKALHVMLAALERLPEAHLAILGDGALRAELERAAAPLDGRVRFLGFRDDVVDYVRAADVFCLSSVWEGVPLAAQEAIQVGIPIVATAVGGMPELVTDGESGRLVPKGDARALAAALDEVLRSPETAERYAATARSRLLERFSRDRMLEHLARAYREGSRAS